ncbi:MULTISPECIES: hypothetical protein [unclassified Clostridium]|uniref:hypothetical protein n=2 Tax=unclassified Clostridium TaxID=2614128 RepID=UPI00207A0B3A|nr:MULTISPECIES: hypothetical protein [unclassified Clostridium]
MYDDLNMDFNYKYLSDKVYEIDNPEDDEVMSMSSNFKKDNYNVELNIKKFSYEDKTINIVVYIDFKPFGKDKKISEEKCINGNGLDEFIYNIKINISKSVGKYTKEINWIQDEQNEKISRQLYMKVHSLENKFRGIINEYMLRKFGEDWFKLKITNEFNEKSEGFSQWYNEKYKKLRFIKSEIFNLQTNDLISMLKNSYEDEKITKVIKEIKSIKSVLNERSANIIKVDVLNNEDLWTKYFAGIFEGDIESKWNEFSKMRNMIAHNKVLSKEFYEDMLSLISQLDKSFEIANLKMKDRLKSLEEKMILEYIRSCDLDLKLESIDFKNYNDDQEVIDDIFNNGELNRVYDIAEEKTKELLELYRELEEILEDVNLEIDTEVTEEENSLTLEALSKKMALVNNILNKNNGEIINLLINKVSNVNELKCVGQYLTELKCKFIKELESWIETSSWTDEFNDGIEICKFYDLDNEMYSLKIWGWFSIGRGSNDQISIIYRRNDDTIEEGSIDISFGDYSEHDDGYVMPEQGQYIDVDIDKVCITIENDADEIVELLQTHINELSEFL